MYEVQTYTVFDGWVNCWSEEDPQTGEEKPLYFDTVTAAQEAIEEFWSDLETADMDDQYSRDDYRIVPVDFPSPKGDNSAMESDPYGTDPHSPGAKLDAGKPDMSLMQQLGKALLAVGEVMTFGANKYTRGGWQEVPDGIRRYTAAELRHIFKEEYEDLDPDSGLLHAAHGACNALFRLELLLRARDEKI